MMPRVSVAETSRCSAGNTRSCCVTSGVGAMANSLWQSPHIMAGRHHFHKTFRENWRPLDAIIPALWSTSDPQVPLDPGAVHLGFGDPGDQLLGIQLAGGDPPL